MEQNKEIRGIQVDLDLRAFNEAFIRDIPGKRETRRCICIPLTTNYVTDNMYTVNETQIREAIVRLRMWPVSQEYREKYDKKYDWNVYLDISKEARENLAEINPQLAKQLSYGDEDYDKEIVRQALPKVGRAYNQYPKQLPPEEVTTVILEQHEGDDDLPF